MRVCRAIIRLKPYFRKEAFAEAFAAELVRHARAIVRGCVGGHAIVRGGGGGHGVQIDTVGFTCARLPMRAGSHGARGIHGVSGVVHSVLQASRGRVAPGGAPGEQNTTGIRLRRGAPRRVVWKNPQFEGSKRVPPSNRILE